MATLSFDPGMLSIQYVTKVLVIREKVGDLSINYSRTLRHTARHTEN